MIRLELNMGNGWIDSGRTYENLAAAKFAANLGNTKYRIVVDGNIVWRQS